MMRQATFKSQNTLTSGWIEDDSRLKPGVFVKLENDDRWWTIQSISDLKLDKKDIKDAHNSANWFKKDWMHNMGNKS